MLHPDIDSSSTTTDSPMPGIMPGENFLRSEPLSSRGSTLADIVEKQKAFYRKHKTRSFEFRDRQLRILGEAIRENESKIMGATIRDLGKPELEAYGTEVGFLYGEIKHTRDHLAKWMRPKKVKGNVLVSPARSKIISEPLGQVLIISPWNYPFQLTISPLIGAIAAGNTMVLKPSELTPHTSKVIAELIHETFPEEYIAVFEGDAGTSQSLLEYRWDHVFFTGSTAVGRIVAQAAAKHLTPVTLELGGKSPCIVHNDAPVKLAARRITWGKFFNAGQTCVAPDYLLVHEDIKQDLLAEIKSNITKQFGDDPRLSKDFARIVSKKHCERLVNLLEEGRIIAGGLAHTDERYLAPTILDGIHFSSKIMQEEIFGPILPVISYSDFNEALTKVSGMEKPLALYLFTKNTSLMTKVEQHVSFGGGCINDTLMHFMNTELPFGGIGASGVGGYHGKFSFDTFSHKKSMLEQNSWFDIPVRYPPYKNWKLKIFKLLMGS